MENQLPYTGLAIGAWIVLSIAAAFFARRLFVAFLLGLLCSAAFVGYGLIMAGKGPTLSNQFVRLLIKAGVRTHGVKVRGTIREGAAKYLPLSFHCLRHNHTTMLKRGKIPEAIARRIAGHLSIAMSDVYTFLGEDITLAAVDDLPEVVDLALLMPKAA